MDASELAPDRGADPRPEHAHVPRDETQRRRAEKTITRPTVADAPPS